MRSLEEIRAEYDNAVAELAGRQVNWSQQTGIDWSARRWAPVVDTLAWALGLTSIAPGSGRDMPSPAKQDLWNEWAYLDDVVNGTRRPVRVPNSSYLYAVMEITEWLRGFHESKPPSEE
jgi:hypothetical protein